jgi:hypothetical protein
MKGEPATGEMTGPMPGVLPLLGFILLSACVHAFGFYLFQAIYPPAARVGAPPAQVGLLTPGTPEADAILRWINSESPARAVEPARAAIPGLMSLPYIPSYSTVHARPTMAAAPEQPLPDPTGAGGLELVEMAAASPGASPQPPAPAVTALSFSGPLRELAVAGLPSLGGLRESDLGELLPARFLLGVAESGEVQYVFLQDSSGDKALDANAGLLLEKVRFGAPAAAQASGGPLTWGFATFYWGSSVYARPSSAPEGTP